MKLKALVFTETDDDICAGLGFDCTVVKFEPDIPACGEAFDVGFVYAEAYMRGMRFEREFIERIIAKMSAVCGMVVLRSIIPVDFKYSGFVYAPLGLNMYSASADVSFFKDLQWRPFEFTKYHAIHFYYAEYLDSIRTTGYAPGRETMAYQAAQFHYLMAKDFAGYSEMQKVRCTSATLQLCRDSALKRHYIRKCCVSDRKIYVDDDCPLDEAVAQAGAVLESENICAACPDDKKIIRYYKKNALSINSSMESLSDSELEWIAVRSKHILRFSLRSDSPDTLYANMKRLVSIIGRDKKYYVLCSAPLDRFTKAGGFAEMKSRVEEIQKLAGVTVAYRCIVKYSDFTAGIDRYVHLFQSIKSLVRKITFRDHEGISSNAALKEDLLSRGVRPCAFSGIAFTCGNGTLYF